MRSVTKNDVALENCPTCNGAWFDRHTLDQVWARMRLVQMEWEKENKPASPRAGLYDLDHVDSLCPSMPKAERDKRWSELLGIFE
jgi:Zn-finger nucleic acid-binding protein